MKNLQIISQIPAVNYRPLYRIAFALLLVLLLYSLPICLQHTDQTIGLLDQSIWQLLLFSLFSFCLLLVGSLLLLQWCSRQLGLPSINSMVLQFKELALWQQFVFYWASYALLLLCGLLSLAAIF